MALGAAGLHIKGPLPVVAEAARLALLHLDHRNILALRRCGVKPVMTVSALLFVFHNVRIVAKGNI
jgi:hypothetical protein